MSDATLHWHRLLEYDHWANTAALASIATAEITPPKALRVMSHIIAAERLWLNRLTASGVQVVVWPDLAVPECEIQLGQLPDLWREYLGGKEAGSLSETITYTNTKGEGWTNTVEDIILHVILHSAYHRGQIASEIRASGHRPAYTDFIHCLRQEFIA